MGWMEGGGSIVLKKRRNIFRLDLKESTQRVSFGEEGERGGGERVLSSGLMVVGDVAGWL